MSAGATTDVWAGTGFVHPALFYQGQDDYVAETMSFVEAGLAAGEPVAVAVPEPNLSLLRGAAGSTASRIRWADMRRAGRNPGRIIPSILLAFADANPGTRVRIVGEPIWPGRTPMEYPACAQHEALINLAFADRRASILCPYDAARLEPGVLTEAAATHPVIAAAGGPAVSPSYDPVKVLECHNEPLPAPPPSAAAMIVDRGKLGFARDFAAGRAERSGLAEDRWPDVVLVVSELCGNSITHGGGSGLLSVWQEGEQLVVQVRDAGRIADPLAGRHPADPNRIGGHGLLVVNLVADLVRVHTGPGGTTVRAQFAI